MPLSPSFVKTDNTRFVLDGQEFPIVGVNCYFLSYCNDTARLATIDAIKATGANVVRTWGFLNAQQSPPTEPCFQFLKDGHIVLNEGEDGLLRFDALIAAAEQREFRLILPLVNYWDALGGMPTYLRWLFPGEDLEKRPEEFYRRPQARAAFKNWISQLLNRTNTITGQPYRESPAIFAWELSNEARCEVAGGRELLLDWIRDMAQFVKSQDPNHLVALGDEGFLKHPNDNRHLYNGSHGVDFEATLGIPEIDFGTFHFYPYKKQMNVSLKSGDQWIRDHIASGQRANKPALLEEYGIRFDDERIASNEERDKWYARWLRVVYEAKGPGDLIWMFGSKEPSVVGNWDEYIVYDVAEIPSMPQHIEEMRTRGPNISFDAIS